MILRLDWLSGGEAQVVETDGILVGVVVRLDSAAKTVVVKLADGTEHAFHFVKRPFCLVVRAVFHGISSC